MLPVSGALQLKTSGAHRMRPICSHRCAYSQLVSPPPNCGKVKASLPCNTFCTSLCACGAHVSFGMHAFESGGTQSRLHVYSVYSNIYIYMYVSVLELRVSIHAHWRRMQEPGCTYEPLARGPILLAERDSTGLEPSPWPSAPPSREVRSSVQH